MHQRKRHLLPQITHIPAGKTGWGHGLVCADDAENDSRDTAGE
ncbi:hypothetical protein [Prevotella herbatica]|nr:hypothetical protein [Prevotella herbatica]